jgi:hypothetical protein
MEISHGDFVFYRCSRLYSALDLLGESRHLESMAFNVWLQRRKSARGALLGVQIAGNTVKH